jgi:hypothetical protein
MARKKGLVATTWRLIVAVLVLQCVALLFLVTHVDIILYHPRQPSSLFRNHYEQPQHRSLLLSLSSTTTKHAYAARVSEMKRASPTSASRIASLGDTSERPRSAQQLPRRWISIQRKFSFRRQTAIVEWKMH